DVIRRAVPLGAARFLGGGQRLVASRGGLPPASGEASPPGSAGAYARACQLAQPGGDLLRQGAAKGADAPRLCGPGGGRRASAAVRGTVQPPSAAVRLGVHYRQVARVPPPTGSKERSATWDVFVKRTT